MARHQLTAATIKKATDGKLQDGGGLILVKKGDRGKWVFRYSHQKRRREMGLGPWPDLSLAGARASRDKWAEVLATGVDPMVERSAEIERAAEAEREKRDPTL
ncbi:MAG: Arm DNA-binding domain-containing protein, partial [Pseudomonadota bacterium]|nr:Arm DNA-binding domain-containing protein [Pseudomonadota bacterium]